MRVKVLLVEGRNIVRLGIKALLKDQPGIEITGECRNTAEALIRIKLTRPDLVIMDLDSPTRASIQFTIRVKKSFPKVKILIFTLQDYESALINLLEAGADGYMLKNTTSDELVFAVEKIIKEGSYMKPEFILNVLARYKASSEPADRTQFNITAREMDVLNLISEGYPNAQMPGKLFTSVRTIETRRKKLLDKTGTLNTATLIRFAVLNGLIK